MAFQELVNKWISDGFRSYNFEKIDVVLSGSGNVGDGYFGGIFFVKVCGESKNGRKEEFNVALKYGKDSPELRDKFPITDTFKNEIFIYATLVPIYREMEKANNFNELDSFMVKCFNTLLYDNQEVLLLEDLKSLGYELHDILKPFNIDHLKLTFEKYGKLHAFGLAYRETHSEEYNKMRLTLKSRKIATLSFYNVLFDVCEDTVNSVLKAEGKDFLNSLRQDAPEGFRNKFSEFCQIDEPNSVIIHGDSWRNNFMFKYEERNKIKPSAVKFLDFQIIQVASPVYDLAYHFYETASEKEYNEFPTLLRVYHNSLSTCLNQLGYSVDVLFPFSELESQWKKYSFFGVLMGMVAAPYTMVDKTDVVDFTSMNESHLKKMHEQVKKKNSNLLVSRYLSILRHYYSVQY